jgi:hypothetical protein
MRPLASLVPLMRKHSKVLPVIGSEWLKKPEQYSFGGFTGFVFRHAAKWAAVETQSYQPYSFCNMAYHPITCEEKIRAIHDHEGARLVTPQNVAPYDYLVVFANDDRSREHLKSLSMELIKAEGDWSLWRP